MTVLSPIDEVIRDFAIAQHLPRIKKLCVYACTQHWESDPDQLAKFNLHDLIETLIQLAPTLEQLSTYLNQVTQTLSKPAEYLLIANTIVQHLRKLYVGPASLPNLNANPHVYWQIAQTLDHDPDQYRIRKLLVLVCRNSWEFDRDRLLTISLPDLLAELHQLTQTFDNLKAVISSVVQTTSKPVQYEAIASRIIEACQNLYSSQQPDETKLRLTPSTSSSPTHITAIDRPPHSAVEVSHPCQIRKSSLPKSTSLEAKSGSEVEPFDLQPIPAFHKAELYDLRLEIMKYTVPLLSKHLLFLAIYAPPGQASQQEQAEFADSVDAWMSLKNRDLDDLIEAALKQYQTLRNLGTALHLTAQSIKASQRYIPIVDAIVRATKTVMVKHQSSFHSPDTTHQHGQDEEDQYTRKEDQRTCQVFSSTVTFHEESSGLHSQEPLANPLWRDSFATTPVEDALSSSEGSSSMETAFLQPSAPPPKAQQPERSQSLSPGESAKPAPRPLPMPPLQGRPLPEPHSSSPASTDVIRSSSSDETALLT